MLFEILIATITIIILLAASYTDLRTREVPDLLSYSLLFIALGIRAIFSINDINILISGILGLIAAFIIGAILYYTHQWGGADTKLLMGIGAVIGITYPFNDTSFTLLIFITSLFIIGALYSLLWMIIKTIQNPTQFIETAKPLLKKWKSFHIAAAVLTIPFILLTIFYSSLWPFIFLPLIIFYLAIFISVTEKNNFLKDVDPQTLTEGDWLAEPIKYRNKTIINSKTVTKADLKTIKAHKKLKAVKIKEGIPFIPSFLLTYLFILFGTKIIQTILKLI